MDYHPPNGFKLWEIVEDVIEKRFTEFPPKEVINLFLSYIMIERYPLNFVRKVGGESKFDALQISEYFKQFGQLPITLLNGLLINSCGSRSFYIQCS